MATLGLMVLECGQIRIHQNLHLPVWSYLYFFFLIVCVHIQEIPLRIPAAWNNVLLEGSREGEREAREGISMELETEKWA